jgi:hypothetical protein
MPGSNRSFALLMTCAIAASFGGTAVAAPQEGPAASLGLDPIIRGMRRMAEAFDSAKTSFYLHYTQEHHTVEPSGRLAPGEDYWSEIENARKGKLAYTHLRRKTATQKTPLDEWYVWKDDITRQRIFNDINLYNHLIPQIYTYYRYTEGLGVNALGLLEFRNRGEERMAYGAKGPGDNPLNIWLAEVLTDFEKEFRVRPRLESVGGAWCHVVEWPGKLAVWVDHAHGFLPTKYVNEEDGIIYTIQLNLEPFEARPGLWLPKRQETWAFSGAAGKEAAIPFRKEFIRLHKIEFNKLDDSFFKVPIEDEERLNVTDSVRKMQYFKYPKGTDPIENAVRATAEYQAVPRSATTWLLVNGIVMGILGFLFLVSVARERRAP